MFLICISFLRRLPSLLSLSFPSYPVLRLLLSLYKIDISLSACREKRWPKPNHSTWSSLRSAVSSGRKLHQRFSPLLSGIEIRHRVDRSVMDISPCIIDKTVRGCRMSFSVIHRYETDRQINAWIKKISRWFTGVIDVMWRDKINSCCCCCCCRRVRSIDRDMCLDVTDGANNDLYPH